MGSMKKMLGMLPGMGQMREQLENFDEREVDRVEAIVRSMTPAERADVRILNGSRRSRIARGSGTTVAEVNQLVDRFEQAKTMMKHMARAGGMPGMGNMPGMGKKSKGRMAPQKATPKGKSGNPAKRALQQQEAARRAAERSAAGSAFGVGGTPEEFDPSQLGLPAGFEKYLRK